MGTIRNPILPGFHPDPSICRVGGDYYLVTSSFEYFPGVPLFHSRNLTDWTQIGHVLTRDRQLTLKGCRPSGGIYAPTIRWHAGRFYMVTTNTNDACLPHGNFYVWTDDIRGEWSDPIWVDMPGIDPDLFFDADGTAVFSCTNGQSRIDIGTGRLVGERFLRWPGTPRTWAPEAPHLYVRDGWYYTMLAEGGTERGHMVTMARSRSLGGPYEACPHNPILSHRSLDAHLQSTGHADLVEDPDGNWWMVFLATRPVGYPPTHLLGRETCLAPVVWNADGWPVVHGGAPVPLSWSHPALPDPMPPEPEWRDPFRSADWKPEWNFLRNPVRANYRLHAGAGELELAGTMVMLDDLESPTCVGRRLQHLASRTEVDVRFSPAGEKEEAGVSLFLQRQAHYDVFLSRRNGTRSLVARRHVGSFRQEVAAVPCADEIVRLAARTSEDWFEVGWICGGTFHGLMKSEAKFLSTECSGAFTGLYLVLYAQQGGSAYFRDFVYRGGR